ncbi:MAG: GIY-YIG nuclease family protein [Armatimonadota bacterium]|nr:GIY-YIG nuclease family protein [Armatimonadota bacterium]
MKPYYVYILASRRNGTLYVGITNDLQRRMYEHKNGLIEGFTKKYGVHMLVYYDETSDVNAAIAREKHIKGWNRAWKLQIIEAMNPEWKDLAADLFTDEMDSRSSRE